MPTKATIRWHGNTNWISMAFAEAGEIVDDWIERDTKDLEKIIYENRNRKEPYWVILFQATHPKATVHKARPLVRMLKAYFTKPKPMVGTFIGEIDNQKGVITWEHYPKDIPIAWGKISDEKPNIKPIIHQCKIPASYVYNRT